MLGMILRHPALSLHKLLALMLALVVLAAVGVAIAHSDGWFGGGSGTPPNPTEAQLIASVNSDPSQLRTMERVDAPLAFGPMPTGLAEALEKGPLVVHGTVTNVQFKQHADGLPYAYITFAVTSVIKGTAAKEITVTQFGGPWRESQAADNAKPVLLQSAEDPVVLIGDEVIWVLAPATWDASGAYATAWPITSLYRFEQGAAVPLEGNPFGDSVRGLTADALAVRMRDALS